MNEQLSLFDLTDYIKPEAVPTNERTNERYVTHIVYLNNPGHLRMSFRS